MLVIFCDFFDVDYLYDKKSWIDLIKSGLVIYIFMQGIVCGIKDWYFRWERVIVMMGFIDLEVGKIVFGSMEVFVDVNFVLFENEIVMILSLSIILKKKRK